MAILGLCGWCVYRFFKKKRPAKGAVEGEKMRPEDDENALVDNEEVKDDDEDAKKKEEEAKKGRIKWRIEYDFTTQELKVTVSDDK